MKKGCLVSLLILAACAGGYWYVLHGHVEPPALWWGVGLASFFMWISIGAMRTAIASAQDAARVTRDSTFSGYTGEQYEDGATVTVAGHIRAVGQSLRAPFSGKPAVLVSYEIDHTVPSEDGSTDSKDYSGFVMVPCAIDSTRGAIRLFGFPLLEGFPKVSLDGDEARRNAASFLAETTFTEMKGFHPGVIYKEIKDLLTDDDGEVRKDWRMTDDRDLSDKNLHEQIVAPGEQVCAIGRWSAEKRGLIGVTGGVIRLVQGDAPKVVGTLRGKIIVNTIACLVLAAVVNGAVYMLLQVASGKSTILADTPLARHSIHGDEMHEAVNSGNIAAAETLFASGTGVDVPDSDGKTSLAQVKDPAMARWLIAHGAHVNAARPDGQTVLMEQSAAGNTEIVRALVNAGAKLDAVSSKWHSTALQRALDGEHLEIARILRDAGAKDDTVTETRGQKLGESDPPVVAALAYLDAIQREDQAAMKEHSTFQTFDDVDFKLWKSSRPLHPRLAEGFATADTATIHLRGAIPSGIYETWTYQLVNRSGDWRVSSERWETRLSSADP